MRTTITLAANETATITEKASLSGIYNEITLGQYTRLIVDGAEVTFKHITLERLGTRVIELVNGAQLHVGALGFASMGASIVYRIGAGCALTFDASQWDPEVVANTTFDFASQGSGSLKYFPSSIRNGSTVPTSPAIPKATCSKSPARAAPSASRCATAASSPTGRADDSTRRVTRPFRPRRRVHAASPRRRKLGGHGPLRCKRRRHAILGSERYPHARLLCMPSLACPPSLSCPLFLPGSVNASTSSIPSADLDCVTRARPIAESRRVTHIFSNS